MNSNLDILIINNVPTFYKINLYNELSTRCKIHVIFLAFTNQVVLQEKFKESIQFSYEMLSTRHIDHRNRFHTMIRLLSILISTNYKKIIFGGYVNFEFIILMFFTSKKKNCLQLESSIRESKTSGIHAILKKIIFSRFSVALPSGKLHSSVFVKLGFKGKIIETKGVGIFNKQVFESNNEIKKDSTIKYLYVGRLIPVKNLELLIKVFNVINKPLTIVGEGYLELALKAKAKSNITFTGFIDNIDLKNIYKNNDIFILPSISEPWGLVVEEAVYFGLPVIVSDAVGCQFEMVLEPRTGVVFSTHDEKSLISAINRIEIDLSLYKDNCQLFDFKNRDIHQIEAYVKILVI
jgi:glycosyltransferase involved in cell wall biosynthesis